MNAYNVTAQFHSSSNCQFFLLDFFGRQIIDGTHN